MEIRRCVLITPGVAQAVQQPPQGPKALALRGDAVELLPGGVDLSEIAVQPGEFIQAEAHGKGVRAAPPAAAPALPAVQAVQQLFHGALQLREAQHVPEDRLPVAQHVFVAGEKRAELLRRELIIIRGGHGLRQPPQLQVFDGLGGEGDRRRALSGGIKQTCHYL